MAIVATRKGPVVRRPRVVVGRLKGKGEKRSDRLEVRPQRVAKGRKVTRKMRRGVGASMARGTWCRKVALR